MHFSSLMKAFITSASCDAPSYIKFMIELFEFGHKVKVYLGLP